MQTTSHFIAIDLKTEIFSDIFINVFKYVKENNLEDIVTFQNPISSHITLYYLEKDINLQDKDEMIKDIDEMIKDIDNLDINNKIFLSGFGYFLRSEGGNFIMYFTIQTELPLVDYRNNFHSKYNRDQVENNDFKFSPHVTFLKIKSFEKFESHRENIEAIILEDIDKIKESDINKGLVSLYAANSEFKEEIQIKL